MKEALKGRFRKNVVEYPHRFSFTLNLDDILHLSEGVLKRRDLDLFSTLLLSMEKR